ncbi:sensor histidine kinase [Nakamurella sp. GG22]
MEPAELRSISLFDGLDDAQLAQLVAVGEEVHFTAGKELFQEARPALHWWVLLAGTVDLLRTVGHEETVLGHMERPGQWAGGFQAWDSSGVYLATARAATAGRMLRVPAERLRDLANVWFPFGVHFISGLVHTVRNIESMARQREALVALGTLAAGLAHEINNPASAATRAVDALQETAATLLSSLGRLAQGSISAEQFVELDKLRQAIPPVTGKLKPLELADREDAISDWLAEHGVDNGWTVAPALAAAGLDLQWCDRAAEILDGPALGSGLEWVASSLATATLLTEIKESTGRISELVAAVKSYSHMDRASLQRTDITEGLDSTLVMLGHKLGDGIAVVRTYGDDVPPVEVNVGELNQVWTNLIDNAVHAMAGTGTLTLRTSADTDHVIVEISDTGTGMPPEVQARAFDPFYTTKGVGEGTGLGLDISRRIIVERHAGEISIESSPAGTTFLVRLPRRATHRQG